MFSCAIGYRLNGSSISMCIAPGDRPPGTWSSPLPSCEGKVILSVLGDRMVSRSIWDKYRE